MQTVSNPYKNYDLKLLTSEKSGKNVRSSYFYGFGGYEGDPEIKGEGNSYTTEFRQYDPRLGRWLSIDPMASKFPHQSPYVGMDNNPVLLRDPSGGETETDFYDAKTGALLKHVEDDYGNMAVKVDAQQFKESLALAQQNGINFNDKTSATKYTEQYMDLGLFDIDTKDKIVFEYTDIQSMNNLGSSSVATNSTTVGGGGTMPITTPVGATTVTEVSSDVSNGFGGAGTVIGYAADGLPFPPGPVSTIGKVVGTGGGVLGAVDNGIQSYNDFNQGSYVRGTINTVQTGAYLTGTVMLFTPAAPIGAAILFYATISDWLQSGVEYGTGVSEY